MRIAFVYPGQGSLRDGMAAAWADHPAGRAFHDVGEVAGLDLVTLADDAASGRTTAIAQPAIFAASLAAHRALAEAGVRPDVVAGHSLGEVTAAVGAGALSERQGAELVTARGRAMGEACAANPGTMAAVLKVDDDVLDELARRVPDAALANLNAPGQTVVSGTPAAVERLAELAKEAGGRVRMLDVEGAFHSPAMAPALVAVDRLLRRTDVAEPTVPLVTGTSGAVLRTAGDIARALVDGILAPVRWRSVQERLVALDVGLIVEVGPGGVLKGLAKRTIPDVPVVTVEGPEDVAAVIDHDVIELPELSPTAD